jgi:hypothetical protein
VAGVLEPATASSGVTVAKRDFGNRSMTERQGHGKLAGPHAHGGRAPGAAAGDHATVRRPFVDRAEMPLSFLTERRRGRSG